MQSEDPRSSAPESDGCRRDHEVRLRRVAHDINGALNTLVLNVELLDRALAARDTFAGRGREAASDSPQEACERCLASLRRAVAEIQRIVGQRLLPLAGGDSDPAPGAR